MRRMFDRQLVKKTKSFSFVMLSKTSTWVIAQLSSLSKCHRLKSEVCRGRGVNLSRSWHSRTILKVLSHRFTRSFYLIATHRSMSSQLA